ncbi:MAG: DnaJ domain-containing protein [Phycisphaeraceae bacterium]|nr:DnaJ domain-containing protein [Phycisphaeraceae bacterium]
MAASSDFYAILGVPRTASDDEIRRAFRRLARELHPDVNKSPDAAERFARVTEAYETLSDPERRTRYDQFGHAGGPTGPAGAGRQGTGPGWTGASGWTARGPHPRGGDPFAGADAADMGAIFEELFGRESPFHRDAARRQGPVTSAAAPTERTISIPFLTAALGGTQQVRTTIHGQTRTIDVRIPAGVETNARLRIPASAMGPGATGPKASRAAAFGDLVLSIEIEPHPWFRREGLDVVLELPVSVSEAILGTTVRVPLLRGEAELRVPPGTASGRRLRLRGKGIVSEDGRTGDFHAQIRIDVPDGRDPAVRRHAEALRAVEPAARQGEPWESIRAS